MSFSFNTDVIDLDEDSVKSTIEAKISQLPEGTGKDEAVALQHGIIEAAINACGLVRGDDKYVAFSVSGHGILVDGEFTNVSMNVTARRPLLTEINPVPEPDAA